MKKTPILPFILITSLFLMWGLANNMTDTLLAAFKKIKSMTDAQTSLIQVAFYGAYFCLALPAAILIKKYTYKSGVLVGLGLFITGALLFYPASKTMAYGHFLAALYILAGGLSILETTANPYIIAMGPEATATRRLNLAQSFNPIGSITGVILSKVFILSQLNVASAEERAAMSPAELKAIQSEELGAVMGPYVGVALLLMALWITIALIKMPRASDEDSRIDYSGSFKRLFARKHYIWGVIAQFFYVGAQIGVWSFTIRYVMQELNLDEAGAATYYLAALVVFTLSRFVFTWLMRFIEARRLLGGASLAAILLTLAVIFGGGYPAVIALVGISACMSLMFPTIFGLASVGLGEDTKIGGSGLIMAILGGAVLTAIQGLVSDTTGSIHFAFFVPLLCFVAVAYYGFARARGAITEPGQ
ncbi:MAG: L-fucose:H+ symporter permease [Lewinellaceae bacterium]|nr:L-fucose:H+ symporter permease [Lewinellaceae bacterium]MCB9287236.1 L-fucose:H+ symporter permease [Lewinellaceae bacterium]